MKLSILDCGKSKSVRELETVKFVVGTDEDIDKHPWVAVIKDEDDKLHCGGSIVSSNRQSHYLEVAQEAIFKVQNQDFYSEKSSKRAK